jgi:hypothetical protein
LPKNTFSTRCSAILRFRVRVRAFQRPKRRPMSREGLDALRARVNEDAALALRLRATEPESAVAGVLRLAGEVGCDVTESDVRAAMAETNARWRMRWIL